MIEIGLNKKDNLVIRFSYDKDIVELMHQLPSRAFNKKTKLWEIPLIDLPILRDVIEPYILRHRIKPSITPLAKQRYFELIEHLKEIQRISQLEDIDYDMVGMKSEVKLYPFQKVGAVYLEKAKRALLAFDMGLGKTPTALAAASSLICQEKIHKPLIICPSSLKFSWAIEIAKFSDYTYTIINGDAKKRKEQYNNSSNFTIVNYDLLRHDITKINDIAWDLVIADEIQRAKNYSTAISRNIRVLQPEYIFGLTGTPIENEIMDLFTLMRFINNAIFGGNGLYFKTRYCNVDSWGGIHGYRDDRHHEIERKVGYCMIRRKKRDVLKDLPNKIVKFYYITLSEQERRLYNEYKLTNLRELEVDLNSPQENSSDVLTRIVFLREICDCLNLMEDNEKIISSKLDELKNIMADLDSESKVVIFTEYERMAQIIQNNMPYQSVHLHGGVKNGCKREDESEKLVKKENKGLEGRDLDLKIHEAKKNCKCTECPYSKDDSLCNTRKKILSKFDNDPNIRLFISTNAGKEGLNLQVAPVVINYDMSFNPAVNEQRIARIDRIGQKSEKILVINMVCHDTIEEKILKVLKEKQDLFDKVIDRSDIKETEVLKKLTIEDLKQLM